MLNRFFLDHIFKIILITFILFDGCRTVSPPVIQKTQKPSKGPVAADSQAAADKAFEEMEHPNEPVAPTPNASNEPVHEKNKKEIPERRRTHHYDSDGRKANDRKQQPAIDDQARRRDILKRADRGSAVHQYVPNHVSSSCTAAANASPRWA